MRYWVWTFLVWIPVTVLATYVAQTADIGVGTFIALLVVGAGLLYVIGLFVLSGWGRRGRWSS